MKEHQKVAHGAKSVCHNNKTNHAMGSQDPGSKKRHTLTEVQRKERLAKCWLLLARVTKREHLTTVFTDKKPFAVEAYHYSQLLVVCARSNMTASHNSLSAVVIVWDGVTAMGHTLLVLCQKALRLTQTLKNFVLFAALIAVTFWQAVLEVAGEQCPSTQIEEEPAVVSHQHAHVHPI